MQIINHGSVLACGNIVGRISDVTSRPDGLVLKRVTIFCILYKPTEPGHSFRLVT